MSRLRANITRAVLSLLASCATPALADSAVPSVRVAGYGTLSYSWDGNPQIAAIRDVSQRPHDGFATDSSWTLDSRAGVQASYQFSPHVTGLVQLVLRDQTKFSAKDLIELAYLDLHSASNFRLRFGRVGYDGFLMSDHRNLGYAYAWVRPPTEFYGWIPIFGIDGADLTYQWDSADASWRARAQAGRHASWVPMGDSDFHFRANSLWSISLQRESGPWRLKAGLSGFVSATEVQNLAPLHAGLQQIAALPLPAIAGEATMLRREMRFGDVRLHYSTLGVAYDDADWMLQAETGRTWTAAAMTPAGRSGYVVFGRHLNAWTPYAILSASRPQNAVLAPQTDWSVIGQRQFQNMAYLIANSSRAEQSTISLGARWDFHPRAALKMQWDHSRVKPQGYAQWFRTLEVYTRSSQVNLYTVGMDFLF